MKTLNINQPGLVELTEAELLNNHGGGDNTSILNIGSIVIADLVDVSGNNLANGDFYAFSNNTSMGNFSTSTSFTYSSSES